MLLKLEHVQKNYAGFSLDCSLEVIPGHITGLIGANGAGKSTTFKAILGLLDIEGGQIELLDKAIDRLTAKDKEDIGAVLAQSTFSGYLNIRKIIPVMQSLYPKFDKTTFIRQCQDFSLPMDKNIKDFSTGMQAKLKLLVAMSHDARLLILDEPTAGLDVLARDELLDMLRQYMEVDGRAILISSHISSDLEGICDDIYMIADGRILFHEDTDEILGHYGLLKMSTGQYDGVDKSHLLRVKKEGFGYLALTREKRFYQENYPDIVMENGSIDDVLTLYVKGETV